MMIANDRQIFGIEFEWLHVELKSKPLFLCLTEVSTTSLQKWNTQYFIA